MKLSRKISLIALAAALAACVAAFFLTGNNSPVRIGAREAESAQPSLVDSRLLETARRVAALAGTADEQTQAREALRLADHELDQAFSTAMREAVQPMGPPSLAVLQLGARAAQARARVEAGEARAAKLAKDAERSDAAAEQLQLAQAQLALDRDDLDDASQELVRRGGDRRARIQQELQAHEAAQQQVALPKVVASSAVDNLPTLKDQAQAWFALTSRRKSVEEARRQAAAHAAELARQHDALAGVVGSGGTSASQPGEQEDATDTAAVVDRLRRLSDQAKTIAELGRRGNDSRRLAAAYADWETLLDADRRVALHGMLGSLAWILGVVLAVVLASAGVRRAFSGKGDRRRMHQLRVMATIAAQLVGLAAIALIVFGPPTQLTTIIGLTTAGLTVVLKDFIVAFFGWFALMGRNGIRVGDWVEIEGVSGEVVEIGLLKTVLLEMGNWTATGHPTGRRVSFVNSFAIERHFFNFSTAGQWLWDELQVSLPSGRDPYELARVIGEAVERETEEDAKQAELEWERVTRQYGVTAFKAKPAVSLRPSSSGFEAVVRYITRASSRTEMKSRLFQKIVDLLRHPSQP